MSYKCPFSTRSFSTLLIVIFFQFLSVFANAQTIGGMLASDDFDGDGIINSIDLDDDNDGILDATEMTNCNTAILITPSAATSSPVYGGAIAARTIDGTGFTGSGLAALATAPATLDDAWLLREPLTSGFIEYTLPANSNIGGVVLWAPDAFNYGGGDGPPKDFTVEITYKNGLVFNTGVYTTARPNSSGANPGAQVFNFPQSFLNATKVKLNIINGWYDVNGNSIGQVSTDGQTVNAAYNMFLGEFRVLCGATDIDTDNDGIPNRLDLDSDGDGCTDAAEAGVSGTLISGDIKNGIYEVVKNTTTKTNAIAAAPYGSNGLADGVETAPESGLINYTSKYDPQALSKNLASCADTDGDGVFDSVDIDDDNDGVLDSEESPSCYMTTVEWNTTDKSLFVKITSDLNTLAPNSGYGKLTDGDGNGAAIQFSTATAQAQLNKAIYKIEFSSPTQLDALYIKKNSATQIFAATAASLKLQGSTDNTSWTDLTAAIASPADASNTTVNGAKVLANSNKFSVTTGAGKYKYYRIYGVVAANILSGIANEFFFDVNNASYQASYFPKADCSNDTDGDGILNHQDLDSDGDGCSDAIESNSSVSATSVSVFPTGGDANTNGLLNVYESGTAGVVNYASAYDPYALSANLAFCKDTDGDGISDITDLDDDNDGILDAAESPDCFYTENNWHYGNRSDIIVTSGMSMVSPQNQPQKLVDGKNSGVSYDVRMETTTATLNALGSGRQVYMFNMNIPVKLSKILLGYTGIYSHFNDVTKLILRGSNDGTNWTFLSGSGTSTSTAAVTYDATINTSSATETSTIYPYPATNQYATSANIFSVTQNAAKYQYYDIFWSSGGGINNTGYANEVYFDVSSDYIPSAHPKIDCSNDTDGDGILNHQDLDSDGDGCPDAKEAGITATLTSASVTNLVGATIASGTTSSTLQNAIVATSGSSAATFGNNGFVNTLETASESGIYSGTYNYSLATNKSISTCLDSDSDGVPDVLDLDDDNDGVLDIVECPIPGKKPLVPRFDIASGASKTATFTSFPEELWIDIWSLDNNFSLQVNGTNITNVSELNFAPMGNTTVYSVPFTDVVRANSTAIYPLGPVWNYPNASQYPMIRVKINKNGYAKIYGYDFANGVGNYEELLLVNAAYQKVPINLSGDNTVVFDQDNTYAPSFLNAEFNTFNSAGFCDTDGDGLENRLDLDSDNDGCSDAYEAKTTTDISANFKFTSGFGTNGFVDTKETTADNGIYNGYYPYDFAIDATIKACLDSDADGVPDVSDLDDDNDGILDAVESPTCFYSLSELAKPASVSSDLDPYDATGTYLPAKSIDGLIATYSAFKSGQYLANKEILKYTANGLIDITSLTLDLDFRAISTDVASTFRFQGSADNVLWDNLNTAAVSSLTFTPPATLVLTNNLQAGKKYKYFRLYGVAGTSNFGGVANATFNLASSNRSSANPKLTCTNDTDGDGIPNHLDLDSDGDACPDAKEAGVIGTLTTGNVVNLSNPNAAAGTATSTTNNVANAIAAGTYSANGFADALEIATESGNYSGTYNYDFANNKLFNACTDTDGDGVTDLFDIDDDNDGILDAVESPSCFYNRVELSIPVDISTELLPYSSNNIEKALDGNTATASAFAPSQNWVGKVIFKYSAISSIPIASIDIDLVNWGLSSDVNQTFKLQGSNDNSTWSDLSAALNSTTNTGTFNIRNTLLPTAKFKYYRVIGVAGTSYYGGVLESRFVLASSFVQSQYTKPTCLTGRSDADLIPNHLDLDSDGDGCSDALEAGTTMNTTANFAFTGSASDFGANGFYNALENTAAESNLYKGIYTYDYATDATFNACTDTDGDGVGDLLDIDDDNDGILDAVESPTCFYTIDELIIPASVSSELTQYTTNYVIGNSIDGVGTTASAFSPNQDWVNKEIFKFTAKSYIPISGMSFDLVSWALSSAAASTFKLQGSGDNLTWVDLSTPTFSSATTGTFTISNTLATTTKFKYFRILGVAGSSSYGGVYEARFNLAISTSVSANPKPTCLTGRTDGDILPNHLDLDSDGDGCSDALESGTSTNTTANYSFTGSAADFGANGFYNTLEKTNAESNLYKGFYTYYYATDNTLNACLDSDGDGTKDINDLDDDNDGVLDYVEQSCTGSVMSKSDITISSAVNWYYQNAPTGLYSLFDGSLIQQIYPTDAAIANKTVFQFNLPAPKVLNLIELANVANQTPFIAGGTYKIQGSNDEGTTWNDIVSSQVIANSPPVLATTNSIKFDMPSNYKSYVSYRIYAISMTGQANWSTEVYFRELSCIDINTDGDASPNRLDLDSDGDACPDAVEAGTTLISTSGVLSNARLSTSIIPSTPNYGLNGFANGLETTTESGVYTGTYSYKYAIDATISACLDSDNDGVSNVMDIDDDNDGVLDTNEQVNCITSGINLNTLTFNGTSITSKTANSFSTAGGDVWRSSYSDQNLKLPISLKFKHNSTTGYEMFGFLPITKTQTADTWTDAGYKFYNQTTNVYGYFTTAWDFSQAISLTDELSIDISATGYVTAAINGVTQKAFQGVVSDYKLAINAYRTSSLTEIILTDATRPVNLTCTDIDTDTDGIPNRLDLDSDGDNCPDAAEAGTTYIATSGVASSDRITTSVIPAPYGSNGFANGLETATESGIYTGAYSYIFATDAAVSACRDTDTDGVPDLIDLDDDNDGVLDSIENGPFGCAISPACVTNASLSASASATGTPPTGWTNFANGGSVDINQGSWQISYGQATPSRTLFPAATANTFFIYGMSKGGGGSAGSWAPYGEAFQQTLNCLTIGQTYYVSFRGAFTHSPGVNAAVAYETTPTAARFVLLRDGTQVSQAPDQLLEATQKMVTLSFVATATTHTIALAHTADLATDLSLMVIEAGSGYLCTNKPASSNESLDTDGDGIPNRLDLDSDGDGCSDAVESKTVNSLTATTVTGAYGNNGFANSIETATESGLYSGTYLYARATDPTIKACLDSDYDGVADVDDLDDDNDGILDANECSAALMIENNATNLGQVSRKSWTLAFINGQDVNSFAGTTFGALRAEATQNVYGEVKLPPATTPVIKEAITSLDIPTLDLGTVVYREVFVKIPSTSAFRNATQISFRIGKNNLTWNAAGLYVSHNGAAITTTTPAAGGGGSSSVLVSTNSTDLKLVSQGKFNGTGGPYYQGNAFITSPANAGKWVRMALSIQDDGSFEQASVQYSLNGSATWLPVDVDNGFQFAATEFSNSLDDSNLVCDTDGDGIPNQLDLDSDGDGCSDANEAYGLTSAQGTDGNQYYGNSPITVDVTGKVIGATYSATSVNVITVGAGSTITAQPTDQSVNIGGTAVFATRITAGTGTTTYQWQVSADGGTNWTNVTNSTTYAGAGTLTLTVSNVPLTMKGYRYRLNIAQSNYVCGNVTSSVAKLLMDNTPIVVDDNATGLEDTPITGNVLTNDKGSGNPSTALTVTNFTIGGVIYTAGQTATIAGVGTIMINANGTYTFTPTANYNGTLPAIDYTATDANGGSDIGTLNLIVTAVNDAPIAVDDNINTNQNIPVSGNVLTDGTDDYDADGNLLTVTEFKIGATTYNVGTTATIPGVGTIVVNSTGIYTFTPVFGYTGAVPAIDYTIGDGNGGSDIGTLSINVVDVNDAPLATDDIQTINQNTTATGNVLTNDADVDAGATLTVTQYSFTIGGTTYTKTTTAGVVTMPGVGTINITANGAYTFVPTGTFTGTVPPITYTLSDGTLTDNALLDIFVQPVNANPVANDDANTTNEDTPVSGNVITDGTDDSDADGNSLIVTEISFTVGGTTYTYPVGSLVNIPGIGTIIVNANGSYTFTPLSNYNGNVPTISYTISDGQGGTAIGNLNITVTAINDNPIAVNDDNKVTPEDTPVTVNVLANDSDPDGSGTVLTVTQFTIAGITGTFTSTAVIPGKGTFTALSTGEFTFTPDLNYNGVLPTITYTVSDGTATNTATLKITVTPVNDAPTVIGETVSTLENTAITGNVLTNDTDVESGTASNTISQFTIGGVTYTAGSIVDIPNVGTIILNANGTYTFTPVLAYFGALPAITYTVADPNGGTATGTLAITVTPVNDPPVVVNESLITSEDVVANGNVLTNDTDPENNALSITQFTIAGLSGTFTASTAVTIPNVGTITINANGSYTFTPTANYNGILPAITYTVSDGLGGLTNGNLNIVVAAVNDAPIVVNDTKSEPVNTPITGNVLTNDRDIEASTLTVSNITIAGVTYPVGQITTIAGVGTILMNADGTFIFTPALNYVGSLPAITYLVTDGTATSSGTLSLTITPIDQDGDGIPDAIEKGSGSTPIDTDNDGTPDYLDTDSDGDGILDNAEDNVCIGFMPCAPTDTDGDGTSDYRDTDSDGDGIYDAIEGTVDTDGDGTPNYRDLDSDGDGILDSIEKGATATPVDTDNDGTPDYLDLDSDGDGIPDATEGDVDSDGDGIPNFRDVDSDGDGIPDSIEKGTGTTPIDTDGDGIPNYLDTDSDGDGILDNNEDNGCTGTAPCTPTDTDGDGTPDYLDLDSDNDGILDRVEKGTGTTPVDTDNDGTPDFRDLDSDGDGIVDAIEKGTGATLLDTDGDGTPNYLDVDSDNDGIPDSIEKGSGSTPVDTDGDGVPDYLDTDSDGDGIPDSVEDAGCTGTAPCTPTDTDGDGIPNYKDLDSDGDGITDAIEKGANGLLPSDTDGDGTPDYLDLDADGDGISDAIEKGTGSTPVDTDGDGTPDYRDTDSDNDGISDLIEKGPTPTPVDTDGDGTPDFRDLDSDGDGKPDQSEGNIDTDGDGTPNFRDLDSDGDGVLDAVDVCPLVDGLGSANGCPPDSDGDGLTDADDADDDNDGILDTVEAAACAPTNVECDTDGDGIPNRLDIDSDGDGIFDVIEGDGTDADKDGKADGSVDINGIPASASGGLSPPNTDGTGNTNPYDTDSDGDGIPDAIEKGTGTTLADTDGDGTPDYLDVDSDGDGISDLIEKGTGASLADTDNDGIPDFKDLDSDGDGIPGATEKGPTATPLDSDGDGVPDFRDLDSDGDGIVDAVEDAVCTGITPCVPTDTDADGTPDYLDADSDGDGIPDAIEKGTGATPDDTDGDGTPDYLDTDSDGDGILDATEDAGCTGTAPCTPTDTDGDGIPNFRDLDSDGDGIPDAVEKGAGATPVDTDNDGTPDYLDTDSDGDGILDSVEDAGCTGTVPCTPTDTDNDGIPNYLDIDSDGDNIPDTIEKGTTTSPVDTDSDGTPDYVDTDTDGDGIPDSVEDAGCAVAATTCTPSDTDGDGIPNHKDLDSDGDGIPDSIEKGPNGATPSDTDNDGTPDYLDTDSDGDGISDAIEKGINGSNPLDTDGDGIPDYKEMDSDNDGIPDSIEKGTGATPLDTDGDGIPDYRDTDSDNDGILDNTEDAGCTGTAPCTPTDTDGDGIPNYRDLDSDGDNKTDLSEGENDFDGDGIPNYLDTDSDGDGVLDIVDQCPLLPGLVNLNGCPVDTDGDGVYDINDSDDDNDGILDTLEAAACAPAAPDCDTDGDGIPNRLDPDSDNDGIPDVIESNGTDMDGDGKVDGGVDANGVPTSSNGGVTPPNTDGTTLTDPYDTDSDGDGISDAIEKGANGNNPVDTDGDGIPDYRDTDSDNDGIPDSVERGTGGSILDTDGDGIPDYRDTDSDGDGILDSIEDAGCTGTAPCTPTDTDGDGIPNYRDIDSDGDGIKDSIEKGTGSTLLDTDGDGTPNYLDVDSDGDGISDAIEKGLDSNNPIDTDGDGKPDYLDTDSDNDGIPDAVEKGTGANPIDTDGDGIPDYRDTDADGDGILDAIEDDGCTGTAPCTPTDTDGDGIPNYLDLDTDGDGKPDAIEKGPGATPMDSDRDGIPDYRDVDNLGNPDVNVTNKNTAVTGNLKTNDEVPVGSTYQQPAANPSNPTGATLVVNTDGTYTFTATTAGKYIYYVPVCGPNQTNGCPLTPLAITVLDPLNGDKPVANNDFATIAQGTPIALNVLVNDRAGDIDKLLDPSSLIVSTAPNHGTTVVNNDGSISYTPGPYFVGTDSLTYQVCDNNNPAKCQTAVAYFKIEATGVTPITTASDDYISTVASTTVANTVSGTVLLNDQNAGGGNLATTLVAGPTTSQGTLVWNTDGTYLFTPAAGFVGPINIVYEVCGGSPLDCAKATLHILVNPPPTLVNDTATALINLPVSGNISTNDIVPAGTSYGTPVADPSNPALGSGAASSGAVLSMTSNGTFTFTASVAGTYTYTVPVCAPGQTLNCPTETIVFKVIGNQPQGTINLKYNTLLASDSVHVKLKVYNGVGPYTMIFKNSLNNRIDTINNISDSSTIMLAPSNNNAVFTLLKIIDQMNYTRSSNFDKDTARLTILRPRILLTLRADLPSKLPDNSFKTKIVMKIKNNGGLYLQNVQVNADLTKVFPPDMQFVLDSIKVTSGNLVLNPTYTGFGVPKATSYVASTLNGFYTKYRALSTLSGSDLFNNGVNLDINEEGSVVFYLTLKPGVNIDPLVLQFTSTGDGVLVQNDGNRSVQPTTSISHDNSNINAHPLVTNFGQPLPTYVPFFIINEIGASLVASQPDTVNGGYVFKFKSVIKNYSNSNLDSVAASFDINQFIKLPDMAEIYGTPTVIGTTTFNPNFDGKNDIQFFKGVSQLKVGDSIKIAFDLLVKTAKTKAIWPTYLIAKGITITGDIRVTDTSTNGSNPDPSGNKIPNESVRTIIGIGLIPPPVPVVISAVFEVDDQRNPKNISQFIKTIAVGTVPTWCNLDGTGCSINAPSIPNKVGTYIWCVKALDTLTGLSSTPCVYDTVQIIPINKYNKYDLIKTANNIQYDASGKFIVGFTIKVINKTDRQIDSILIKDDLTSTFLRTNGFKVYSIKSSGTLIQNNAFDGIGNVELLKAGSYLAAHSVDSIDLKVIIESAFIEGAYTNTANMKLWTDYGMLDLISNDTVQNKNGLVNRVPTKLNVPKITLNIPEGFSPNNDGMDDTWIIKHPFGMKIDVKVVNRWGNEVYANPDYKNDWRGKGIKNFLGEDLPEGTYYFIVHTIDQNGLSNKFVGPLTIIR